MIGTTLKKLLDEREIKVNEFARQIHVPAQTLYSIIRRDNMKIDFELLLRICDALHVPLETFCGTGSTDHEKVPVLQIRDRHRGNPLPALHIDAGIILILVKMA